MHNQISEMHSFEQIHNEEETDISSRQHFGNLKVFARNPVHLSLGPHYLGFVAGMTMLLVVGSALLLLNSKYIQQEFHLLLGEILMAISIPAYTLTALLNPGIYNPNTNNQPQIRYCEICCHRIPQKVHHCLTCDVCIQGYDHHCPWVSKCVGKGNLICFYIFISSVSIMSIYMYYSFYLIFWGQK